MEISLMPVVRSGRIICRESESSCLLQESGSCIADGVDICSTKFTAIIFPFLSLLIGAICILIAKKLRVTYHLLVLGAGVSLGLLGCGVDLGLLSVSLRQWIHVNPPAILLYMFLAPLVFAASFNTNWHVFKRLLIPILISALLLLSLQVGLVAFFQMFVIRSEGWSWWSALMFGSMVTPTDSIGVTTVLHILGASPMLSAFVDGESLVGFGSSIVLWVGFIMNASIDSVRDTSDNVTLSTSSAADLVGEFFKQIVGGVAIGVAFALVVLIILSCVYDEYEVETSLTVVVAFFGFWTAQALSGLSGVTANIASGLLLSAFGRQLITPSVRKPLGEFWKLLGWIGSTIIFFYGGVLLSAFAWSCAGEPLLARDYVYIIVWYVFLQVIRIVLFLLFRPVLAFQNKWLGWKEVFFLGFSGLRGALSLLLALEVSGNLALPEEVKSRVILWTTGVVALSLLINGLLLKPVIHGLQFSKVPKPKEEFLDRARFAMVQRTLQILDHLCVEPAYKAVKWSYVIQNVLPPGWLDEEKNASGDKDVADRILNHSQAPGINCIERALNSDKQGITNRDSEGQSHQDDGTFGMALQNLRRSSAGNPDQDLRFGVRMSSANPLPRTSPTGSPTVRETPLEWHTVHSDSSHSNLNVRPVSATLTEMNPRGERNSESVQRTTITGTAGAEQDSANNSMEVRRQSPTVTSSVQISSRGVDYENIYSEETAKDREVRSRMLTAMLSHVRAITNASLVEYSVLVHIEEDIQRALDANGEGKIYNLFSFISSERIGKMTIWHRGYQHLIERSKLKGESLITKTVVVMGTLTSILNGKILIDAPTVRKQAEHLYEGAAALLHRLETLNPYALGWVTSQFAIYLTEHSQDSILSDLLGSGVIDEHELGVMHNELVQIRRKHVKSQSPLLAHLLKTSEPKSLSLLHEHPLFAGLNARLLSQVLNQDGMLVHLQGGQELQLEKGSLVLVLQGGIQPVDNTFCRNHSNAQKRLVSASVSRVNTESPAEAPNLWRPAESLRAVWGSSNQENMNETHHEIEVVERPCSGPVTHWCFSRSSSFCGHSVILDSYNNSRVMYPVDRSRLLHTRFRGCDHANLTTVFTLSARHVKALACVNEEFRLEITRSMAREMVLSTITEPSPYSLSNFFQFAHTNTSAAFERAFKTLERLPYMKVEAISAEDDPLLRRHGPAMLINGTVQVLIAEIDGSRESLHVLHEELTGPALLPSGTFVLREVLSKKDSVGQTQEDGETRPTVVEGSKASLASSLESDDQGQTIAHILIDTLVSDDIGLQRLRRWTVSDVLVDMNGRFGMPCHVDLAPLREAKVN